MLTPKNNLRTGLPYWLSQPVPRISQDKLTKDTKADVAIIGAGITGAMTAQALAEAGFKVVLLDRRGALKGATSATTALLQYDIDQPLIRLSKQIGNEKAMRAWRRSKLALESLAAKIGGLQIKCEMARINSLYLAGNLLDTEELKEEWSCRKTIGLHADYLTKKDLQDEYGIARNGAIRSYDNITANPLHLAAGFLKNAVEHGAEIYSPVSVIDGDADMLITKDGPVVRAKYIIYATGYEIPKLIKTRKHKINSTYAIATKPQKRNLWPGEPMIWESSEPYLYLRTLPDGRVICGGEDEEFKDEEKRDALIGKKTAILERKLNKLFPHLDATAEYAWTGSFGASTTGLPTIGKIPGTENCYSIMAFGGNGITFSALASEILLSELTGGDDPDADLFAF